MLAIVKSKKAYIKEVYNMTDELDRKFSVFFRPSMRDYAQQYFSIKLPNTVFVLYNLKDSERLCELLNYPYTCTWGDIIHRPYSTREDDIKNERAILYWSERFDYMMESKKESFINTKIREADIVIDVNDTKKYSALNAYNDLWKFRDALKKGVDYTTPRRGLFRDKGLKNNGIVNKVNRLSCDAKFTDLIIKLSVLGEDEDMFMGIFNRDSSWLESLFKELRFYTEYLLDGADDGMPRESIDVSAELDKLEKWKSTLIHHVHAPK